MDAGSAIDHEVDGDLNPPCAPSKLSGWDINVVKIEIGIGMASRVATKQFTTLHAYLL